MQNPEKERLEDTLTLELGAKNEIPESITQSDKVQQVSKAFPILKSPTPFQSTSHSKGELRIAKGFSTGSSLRIIMTTSGKT